MKFFCVQAYFALLFHCIVFVQAKIVYLNGTEIKDDGQVNDNKTTPYPLRRWYGFINPMNISNHSEENSEENYLHPTDKKNDQKQQVGNDEEERAVTIFDEEKELSSDALSRDATLLSTLRGIFDGLTPTITVASTLVGLFIIFVLIQSPLSPLPVPPLPYPPIGPFPPTNLYPFGVPPHTGIHYSVRLTGPSAYAAPHSDRTPRRVKREIDEHKAPLQSMTENNGIQYSFGLTRQPAFSGTYYDKTHRRIKREMNVHKSLLQSMIEKNGIHYNFGLTQRPSYDRLQHDRTPRNVKRETNIHKVLLQSIRGNNGIHNSFGLLGQPAYAGIHHDRTPGSINWVKGVFKGFLESITGKNRIFYNAGLTTQPAYVEPYVDRIPRRINMERGVHKGLLQRMLFTSKYIPFFSNKNNGINYSFGQPAERYYYYAEPPFGTAPRRIKRDTGMFKGLLQSKIEKNGTHYNVGLTTQPAYAVPHSGRAPRIIKKDVFKGMLQSMIEKIEMFESIQQYSDSSDSSSDSDGFNTADDELADVLRPIFVNISHFYEHRDAEKQARTEEPKLFDLMKESKKKAFDDVDERKKSDVTTDKFTERQEDGNVEEGKHVKEWFTKKKTSLKKYKESE